MQLDRLGLLGLALAHAPATAPNGALSAVHYVPACSGADRRQEEGLDPTSWA